MTRDRPDRFDPIVCVDEAGRLLGAVGIERLTLRLAQAGHHPRADHRPREHPAQPNRTTDTQRSR